MSQRWRDALESRQRAFIHYVKHYSTATGYTEAETYYPASETNEQWLRTLINKTDSNFEQFLLNVGIFR